MNSRDGGTATPRAPMAVERDRAESTRDILWKSRGMMVASRGRNFTRSCALVLGSRPSFRKGKGPCRAALSPESLLEAAQAR